MSPELYFAVMLITNPQKAKRILIAEDWENWFMDLFDEEYEDILNGTFISKQEEYVDRIVDKYLELAGVKITNTDKYSLEVIEKAIKTATEIQETTMMNVLYPTRIKDKTINLIDINSSIERPTGISTTDEVGDFIKHGIAFAATAYSTEHISRWLSENRAEIISVNEANWICNHEEYDEALSTKTTKVWHTALDEKVRDTHIVMEDVEVPIDEPFHVGSSQMMYPQDVSLGADASEIINCRCTVEYK